MTDFDFSFDDLSAYDRPELGGYDVSSWLPQLGDGTDWLQSYAEPESMYVFDNQTGQVLTLAQAYQIDPAAATEYAQQNNIPLNSLTQSTQAGGDPTGGAGTTGVTPAPLGGVATQASPGQTPLFDSLPWLTPNLVAGTLGAGTLGVGVAGVIQKAMQGDQVARTRLERHIAQASPQEQQAIQQAIQGFTQLQNFAMGTPESLMGQLGARVPGEEAAYQSALGGTARGQQSLEQLLYGSPQLPASALPPGVSAGTTTNAQGAGQGLIPQLGGGLGSLLDQQGSILGAYTPYAERLARGELVITPEMARTVEQAFQPQMGDIATQAIESARRRGFAGGAELLNQGPAAALAGPALADLQGQMAGAKLNLAQAIPGLVGQASGAYSTPAALRLQGMGNLANINQTLLNSLGNYGQQGMGNRLDFLRAASTPLTGAGNIGTNMGNQRVSGADTTQTTTQPAPTLLDSFAPLASLLGGAGGLLSGLSATNTGLSGIRR